MIVVITKLEGKFLYTYYDDEGKIIRQETLDK